MADTILASSGPKNSLPKTYPEVRSRKFWHTTRAKTSRTPKNKGKTDRTPKKHLGSETCGASIKKAGTDDSSRHSRVRRQLPRKQKPKNGRVRREELCQKRGYSTEQTLTEKRTEFPPAGMIKKTEASHAGSLEPRQTPSGRKTRLRETQTSRHCSGKQQLSRNHVIIIIIIINIMGSIISMLAAESCSSVGLGSSRGRRDRQTDRRDRPDQTRTKPTDQPPPKPPHECTDTVLASWLLAALAPKPKILRYVQKMWPHSQKQRPRKKRVRAEDLQTPCRPGRRGITQGREKRKRHQKQKKHKGTPTPRCPKQSVPVS